MLQNGARWAAAQRALRLTCALGLSSACVDAPADRDGVSGAGADMSAEVIDWDRRVVSFSSPGWTVEFCEGEGPFLCVARGGETVGSVELLRLSVDQHSAIVEALGRGSSEIAALEAAAAEFVDALSADRRVGHGEDYHLGAESTVEASFMGTRGLRLVVEGGVTGRMHERIVQYYAIQRDSLYLLAATGMAGGGSLGEFAIADLKAFESVFGDIAAVSRVSATAR